jgi:pentapeptide repeat protein
MADRTLVMLKFGARAWNLWRAENPDRAISLDDAKLDGMILTGINFTSVSLRRASLHATNLMNADLRQADLTGCVGRCTFPGPAEVRLKPDTTYERPAKAGHHVRTSG